MNSIGTAGYLLGDDGGRRELELSLQHCKEWDLPSRLVARTSTWPGPVSACTTTRVPRRINEKGRILPRARARCVAVRDPRNQARASSTRATGTRRWRRLDAAAIRDRQRRRANADPLHRRAAAGASRRPGPPRPAGGSADDRRTYGELQHLLPVATATAEIAWLEGGEKAADVARAATDHAMGWRCAMAPYRRSASSRRGDDAVESMN